MGHLLASLRILALNLLLLLIDDRVGVVLTVEAAILDRLDELVQGKRVLLDEVLQVAWL